LQLTRPFGSGSNRTALGFPGAFIEQACQEIPKTGPTTQAARTITFQFLSQLLNAISSAVVLQKVGVLQFCNLA